MVPSFAKAAFRVRTIALVTVLVSSLPSVALACSCGGVYPSSVGLREATFVFTGTVSRISVAETRRAATSSFSGSGATSSAELEAVTFRTDRAFKGIVGASFTLKRNTGCDLSFAVGETWLVYATREGGRVAATKCSRTRLMADAVSDVQYLENLQRSRPQAIVFGNVFRSTIDSAGRTTNRVPFESLGVVAIGTGRQITVSSEPSGAYQLVVPPGEYEVYATRGGKAVTTRSRLIVADGEDRLLTLSARYD